MLCTGAGVTLYALWECPLADLHGKEKGFTYNVDTPEDLCFIRQDGTPRLGHAELSKAMSQNR